MIDITKNIQSLTIVRRRSGDFMKQLKKTKRPVVLTAKGRREPWSRTPKLIGGCATSPINGPARRNPQGARRLQASGTLKRSSKQSMAYPVYRNAG